MCQKDRAGFGKPSFIPSLTAFADRLWRRPGRSWFEGSVVFEIDSVDDDHLGPMVRVIDLFGRVGLLAGRQPSDSFLASAVPELFGFGGFLANTRVTSAFVLLECSRFVAGGCIT